MRFITYLLTIVVSFCLLNIVSGQELNPIPTEAQAQQVVGSTTLRTCANYGNVCTHGCPEGDLASLDSNSQTAYDSQALISIASTIDFKFNHIHHANDYMKLCNIFALVCLSFFLIGSVFAQELNPTPTEVQGQQVIGATPLNTDFLEPNNRHNLII